MFKDPTVERKARNERHFGAAWYGKTSGFEEVHGLLDRVMLMLRMAFLTRAEGLAEIAAEKQLEKDFVVRQDHTRRDGYWLEPINEATFFSGRSAAIYLRLLHPSVLEKYVVSFPLSPHLPAHPPFPPASSVSCKNVSLTASPPQIRTQVPG